MGIIGGFIGLTRWLGIKNLLIIILGTSIFFIGKSYWQKRKAARMPIESLFKEIKYVQELRLITYYYDELLDVGTSDRYENLVNEAEAEREISIQELRAARFFKERAEKGMVDAQLQFEASKRSTSTNTTLQELRTRIRKADSAHNVHKISLFVNVIERIKTNDTIFGQEIRNLYQAYDKVDREIKDKKTNDGKVLSKRELKLKRKNDRPAAKQAIMNAFNIRKKNLKQEVDKLETVYKRTEKAIVDARQSLKGIRNAAEKEFRKAERQLKAALEDSTDKEQYLSRAMRERDAKKQADSLSGEKAAPNMIVIASAEVTGFVDLKQLEFDYVNEDSIVITRLPEAMLDSIIIKLPKKKRYIVGDVKPKQNPNGKGIFFEVYKQLKEAISEAKDRVKERALDAGILNDTEIMARQYLVNFGKSMGYGVGFSANLSGNASNLNAEIEQEVQALRDSIEIRESTEIQNALDSAKVKLGVPAS